MSAIGGKADIFQGVAKSPLIATSGHFVSLRSGGRSRILADGYKAFFRINILPGMGSPLSVRTITLLQSSTEKSPSEARFLM